MTEAIKQWIADQCDNAAPNTGKKQDFVRRAQYSAGVHKGIEIAAGFGEWVDGSPYFLLGPNNWENVSSDQPNLTTSQLLEKYLSHLLNKEK